MKNYRLNGSRRYRFKNSDRKRNKDFNKINHDISSTITFPRRSVQGNNHNVSKLIDKYTTLAKEALSSGDKILSENYLQHADHFQRIQNERENFKREKYSEDKEETVLDSVNETEVSNEKQFKDENSEVLSNK